jgi:CubicO group peptidase (beta-lactamase class C family)
MTEIHGTCDPRFEPVREALRACFDEHGDVGASCAVTSGGELVVDLWGGHTTERRDVEWGADTLVNVWSTTKTMAALCLLVLADRGVLDLDAPVARYWPEFAAEGKDGVLVRHVLGHTAGLPGWTEPMQQDDLLDHDLCARRLAAQAPWWEPGSASGYHAITQGCLENEIVRRVTGMTLGTLFATEVAGPLGADFHIGLAPEHDHRVAPVIVEALEPIDDPTDDSIAARAMSNPRIDPRLAWSAGWRRAEIPAANGQGNARSVALAQSLVAGRGSARGVRLLSPETVERIFEVQADGTDLVLGLPMRLGIGYGLTGPSTPLSPNERTCFWGGWGGSIVVNDLDADLTVAYVMNRMSGGTLGDPRGVGIVFAAYAALAG